MPITQSLNSKANIKKNTNQDLPFSPSQPVIASTYAVSTAGQTVIPLSFSVDTVNNSDSFFLFINGAKLRLGASNDYVFSGIGSNGYSSTVTLNSSLVVGLNIQAYALGLKKETEFNMDNRFVQLYEAQDQGFQAFVNSQSFLNTATQTTGTPAAGKFYSSITNRAAMTDLSQNLKAQMGIERIMTPLIYALPNEFGSAGQIVWGAQNDIFGTMRFVGTWSQVNTSFGNFVQPTTLTDYVEITFFGTGLNLLTQTNGASYSFIASVDGAAGVTTTGPAAAAGVIGNLGYNTNQMVPVVAGLTLGIHTVTITNNVSFGQPVYGFEILNDSGSVKVNPGVAYTQGKKYTSSAISAFAYTAPVTGTRGGRSVVYQNGDGTIGTSWTAVNAASAFFTSTDHTNEEVARIYHFREFGSNSVISDFQSVGTSASARVFCLEDGTTNLNSNNALMDPNIGEAITTVSGTGNFIVITFVGTGIDVQLQQTANGFTRSLNYQIDGAASIGTTTFTTAQAPVWIKLASGLPYGTHILRINNGSGSLNAPGIVKWAVYQPKKPTIPTGTIELADFNVFANYVAGTTAAFDTIATGVLRKQNVREFSYVNGTGGTIDWTSSSAASESSGTQLRTDRLNAYWEYTFFGTGFEVRNERNTTRGNQQFMLQSLSTGGSLVNLTSTAFPTIVTSAYSATFTASTGIASFNGVAVVGAGVSVSNLPLGFYKLRVVNTTASVLIDPDALDIITPIHTNRSDLLADTQNTLPVGSQGISDSRKFTPSKDSQGQKAWAQAVGTATTPSTSSTVYVPIPDMTVVITNKSSRVKVSYSVQMTSNGSNGVNTALYIDGVLAFDAIGVTATTAAYSPFTGIFNLAPGTHIISVYWRSPGGTGVSTATTSRILTVEEQ